MNEEVIINTKMSCVEEKKESEEEEKEKKKKALLTFGAITDVQYADIPNGLSKIGVERFYRYAIDSLQEAIDAWNHSKQIAFAIHLGDVIDGKNQDKSETAMETVLQRFAQLHTRTYHLAGNHDLYHIRRSKLNKLLGFESAEPEGEEKFYFDFTPHAQVRFVCLDSFDISLWGRSASHPNIAEAKAFLQKHNPNIDKTSPDHLEGPARRLVAANGALSKTQLAWFESVLKDAETKQQIVIVCSHVPLHPEAADFIATVWNYEEVLALIVQHRCVKLVMSGHDHEGGYHFDRGVHHLVLPGVIEQGPPKTAFATIEVYTGRIVIVHGKTGGAVQNQLLKFE